MGKHSFFIIFLLFSLFAYTTAAKESKKEAPGKSAFKGTHLVAIEFSNDALIPNFTDQNLTNEIAFTILLNEINKMSNFIFGKNPGAKDYIVFGQEMYTPDDIGNPDLIEDDRPYAGVLYFELNRVLSNDTDFKKFGFRAGIVGRYSLAEDLQKLFHQISGNAPPQGWDHQVNNELGIDGFYLQGKRLIIPTGQVENELGAYGNATVGTFNIHSDAGAYYRINYNMGDNLNIGNLNVQTVDRRTKGKFGVEAYIIANARAVIRDITLDGSFFQDSHTVDKETFVGSMDAGIGMRFHKVVVGYYYKTISKQFKIQEGPHSYGVVYIRYNKKF